MKQKVNKKQEDTSSSSIWLELGMGIFEVFLGSITSKASGSIALTAIAIVCFVCPMYGGEKKPIAFFVIGGILVTWAIILVVMRIKEINKENIKKKTSSNKTN